MTERLFINTLTNQCIIDICNGYNLCRNRYLVTLQSIRIATPVIAFMMPAADLCRDPDKYLILIGIQTFKHRSPDQRM